MKNYLIYIIAITLLSLLLIFVLVLPAYQDLNALNQKIIEKEVSLQSQTDYFEELQNIEDRLEGTEDAFKKINSAIPQGNDLANLMHYFQISAGRSRVSIKNMSPSLALSDQARKIQSSRVNLVLSAYYPDFKSFLSIIERSSRLIEVEEINFQEPREEGEMFDFNISTRVHYR